MYLACLSSDEDKCGSSAMECRFWRRPTQKREEGKGRKKVGRKLATKLAMRRV